MSSSPSKLQALADRWATAKAAERANAQSYIIELCDALGVERPRPAGSGYEFELPIKVVNRDGTESSNFIDCYKEQCFVLEAKDAEDGRGTDVLLRKAFGQARTYAAHVPGGSAPPYILVLDVGKTLLVWDRWSGSFGGYGGARRIDLAALARNEEDAALLRDIWTNPAARDPRAYAQAVTRDIATHLAELAASLEQRGFEQERVARFLMRCVFTMFAEDVALLPDEPFRRILDEVALANPDEFTGAVEELWRAMDEGRRFGFRKLLRFNGHFFKDAEGLPLTRNDLAILLEAAKADWSKVEPSIFGTLLTRALDPVERHRLGAEYTPPEFIERLVRPTVEEPIRERWTAVQAEVLQLRDSKRAADKKKAITKVREFHEWLRALRFLDPACGSGNFLYVTMHTVKRIEVEVLNELADLTGALELRYQEVDPSQFWGIEVKPWAREIAELTLWIGFHQFWRQHHAVQPEEPLLRDTGTLECRDAVLAWDKVEHDPSRDRQDPTPRIEHAVTGELVPDPLARLEYQRHINARPAEWPPADFIIGNPPYLGQARQREAFGDGYVDALRSAYGDVPASADYVMYWWYKAASAVAGGRAIRAGFITTSTVSQGQNRTVIAWAADQGAHVIWAIPDHPWVDDAEGADVRVALTVLSRERTAAVRVDVAEDGQVLHETRVPRLNADLTAHADVASAVATPLLANRGLACPGFKLDGSGFILAEEEAAALLRADPSHAQIIKPYLNGRDLASNSRGVFLLDFGLRTDAEARGYPVLYDIVRDRVKPERDAKPDRARREFWWRLGRPREELRQALVGLTRYIVTIETARHRYFVFLGANVAPDNKLIVIPSADPFHLGVLSSAIHTTWALASGGRLGVGNDPVYVKSASFDAFPFPDPPGSLREQIADTAERLDAHRRAAISRDKVVTLTAMYSVLAKLRSGVPLSVTDQRVHTLGACGVLRDLHDELDHQVAAAYGWRWPETSAVILDRLVALHDDRVREEAEGRVRWLRPDYQLPRYGSAIGDAKPTLDLSDHPSLPGAEVSVPWPIDVVAQITALRKMAAASPIGPTDVAARFAGAPKAIVERHLETLAILGELQVVGGRYTAAVAAA